METEMQYLCENCKFYVRYYVKRSRRLKYAGRGCCEYCIRGMRKFNQIPRVESCEHFSPAAQDLQHYENTKRVLREMRKSLADIALMLGADEHADEE